MALERLLKAVAWFYLWPVVLAWELVAGLRLRRPRARTVVITGAVIAVAVVALGVEVIRTHQRVQQKAIEMRGAR